MTHEKVNPNLKHMPDIPAAGSNNNPVYVVLSVAVELLGETHNFSPPHGGAGSGKIYPTYLAVYHTPEYDFLKKASHAISEIPMNESTDVSKAGKNGNEPVTIIPCEKHCNNDASSTDDT